MLRVEDIESALEEIRINRARIKEMTEPPQYYQEWDKHLARLEEEYFKELKRQKKER